jgi:hypothetical protein
MNRPRHRSSRRSGPPQTADLGCRCRLSALQSGSEFPLGRSLLRGHDPRLQRILQIVSAAVGICPKIFRYRYLARSYRGRRYSTVPHIRSGGEILLHLSGWPKVEKVLRAIDIIEELGIDSANAAPAHWRHVQNRLFMNENLGNTRSPDIGLGFSAGTSTGDRA